MYSFDANTIFVPRESVPNSITYAHPGNCLLNGLVLDNGKQEAFQAFCSESELGTEFEFYDMGYSAVAGSFLAARDNALRRLIPVLGALGCCISLIAPYVTTQSRRKEFAVMRCLGMSRWQIFRIVFSEQTVLALLGGGMGIGIGWMAEGVPEISALGKAGLVIAVFLMGAGFAVLRVTNVNVMKLMKVED